MIVKYSRRAGICLAVFVISTAAAVELISKANQNLWDIGLLGPSLGTAWFASFFLAIWWYLRAKGRSGEWMLLVLFFPVVGLLIIMCLKDLHKEEIPTPQRQD